MPWQPVRLRVTALLAVLGVWSSGAQAQSAASARHSDPARVRSRVLAQGSIIQGAHGMAVDAAGKLWVASLTGRRLVQVDPDSGRILGECSLSDGVDAPDDVVVGPDGTLYFTAI